jgi:hypothetical protein
MKRIAWTAVAGTLAAALAITGCNDTRDQGDRGATSGQGAGTPSPRGTETVPGARPAPGTPNDPAANPPRPPGAGGAP